MEVSLIIIGALAVVGIALYMHDRYARRKPSQQDEEPGPQPQAYLGDEELDAFKGRNPESYTDDEIEQFRDVLLTLLPQDIAGWGRSIQLRGIELPPAVREELLMIVAEARHDAVNPN